MTSALVRIALKPLRHLVDRTSDCRPALKRWDLHKFERIRARHMRHTAIIDRFENRLTGRSGICDQLLGAEQ